MTQRFSPPPQGYHYGPRYRIGVELIARGSLYIARGQPRSLARDALLAIHAMPQQPLTRGTALIPDSGGFVVVANHYERPGLWMAWPALLASQIVHQRTGRETRWIAIQEWERFSVGGIPIPRNAIRHVFRRAFTTYGIIAMAPPDASPAARATSIRAALQALKDDQIIGLMPEGTVGPTPRVLPARAGAGSFLLLLASTGMPLLPLGFFEENDRLIAQFGEPFRLPARPDVPKSERDSWASKQVMEAIRMLLPEPLR